MREIKRKVPVVLVLGKLRLLGVDGVIHCERTVNRDGEVLMRVEGVQPARKLKKLSATFCICRNFAVAQ